MKTTILMLMILSGLIFAVPCNAQETPAKPSSDSVETQLANEYNRIQMFFNIARNRIIGVNDTEAMPAQIEEFKALEKKREEVQSLIKETTKIKDVEKRLASLEAVIAGMSDLEDELVNDILLPQQVVVLRQREFKFLLNKKAGDFEAVIAEYYGKEFGMTEAQKKEMKKIRSEQNSAKRKAGQEYSREIQKIDAEAKSKLGKIFTPKQIKMVEELSGTKFAQSP